MNLIIKKCHFALIEYLEQNGKEWPNVFLYMPKKQNEL